MSSPSHADLIIGTVLGLVFTVGLIFVFAKSVRDSERPASIAAFVGTYFMTVGLGLAIVFIIAHFIVKHW
jgi:uncharacterized membrane protein